MNHRRFLSTGLTCAAVLPVLFTLASSLAGCNSPRADPIIIAHRGASHDAPENTLAAFELAWQRGADGIEGDFHLTADRQIVCIHDKDTKRTAGTGPAVADSTLAELRELDVGAWKDPCWAGQRVPTLAEVLATVPDGRKVYIEVKCGPEIVGLLMPIIAASGLADGQIVIIGFDADVIAQVRRALPRLKALWLSGFEQNEQTGRWRPTPEEAIATLRRIDAHGLSCAAHECVDRAFVRSVRAAGFEFHVWTVNEVETARRFRSLGVGSITTNRPGRLRAELEKPGGREAAGAP